MQWTNDCGKPPPACGWICPREAARETPRSNRKRGVNVGNGRSDQGRFVQFRHRRVRREAGFARDRRKRHIKGGRALLLAHRIHQRHRVVARGTFMSKRALLFVSRITGLRGIMRMPCMFDGMRGSDRIAGIRTKHAQLKPGDHAEKQQPCENVSHQRPGNSAQFGISARKKPDPVPDSASLAFHRCGSGHRYES